MRDTKDTATLELPGFHAAQTEGPEEPKRHRNKISKRKPTLAKQVQLDLLHALCPVDHSGLPIWQYDENRDASGLPIWR
ncbi:hypothetical protein LPB67_07315 [Undibacterium sp. Jales W-56]|uniref:hypothetical protein n=1 Tax=Undibacterium sp. Jales W-56 TaxID=2897325 RepID=UPI0021D390D7|nr:hypothetical protein [Undibacterium sp. Jales W-56]MCU6433584.1 hypothetical protein [Undibacterium sp. Jales W-56]